MKKRLLSFLILLSFVMAILPSEFSMASRDTITKDGEVTLFSEDFEGRTEASLQEDYPRGKRISDSDSDGVRYLISYWGASDWEGAITDGYNGGTAVYTCAETYSQTRSFEAYVPAAKRPSDGKVHISMNVKIQSSLSKQSLYVFKDNKYTKGTDPDGITIFQNSDISGHKNKWLAVDIWVDLDEDTYNYTITDTTNNSIIKQGNGTQTLANVSGIAFDLKKSDTTTLWTGLAPIVDNIYIGKVRVPEIPEPNYINIKELFSEDFEGRTEQSLQAEFPRGNRITDGVCISYWGANDWAGAITSGYNGGTAVYTCAESAQQSRTFEAYIPADVRPMKGLIYFSMNLKIQSSLSKQSLAVFRDDKYTHSTAVDGFELFTNDQVQKYKGKWLAVSAWFDLDEGTYICKIVDTTDNEIIYQKSGSHKLRNIGGIVFDLKKSDSTTLWTTLAPIVDNIYFGLAEKEPDADVFEIHSFSLSDENGTQIDTLAGATSITANVDFTIGKEVSRYADIYLAAFSSNGKLQAINMQEVDLTPDNHSVTLTLQLPRMGVEGDNCYLFVWEHSSVSAIVKKIDFKKKVYPYPIKDGVDIHTDLMKAYLEATYDKIEEYAVGEAPLDLPNPITFKWYGSSGYEYLLKVSESSDMSNSWTYTTSSNWFDVYNLKVGTRYYWTVSAVKNGNIVYTSEIQTFMTNDVAPRNLYIQGSVENARDIGGWATSDGKRVKQGMVYRTAKFDSYDSGSQKAMTLISDGGKDFMINKLGIKTEIDFRQDNGTDPTFAPGKSESVLGSNVNYYHCPMGYDDDYLSGNLESIKKIFEILADESNYPITYHCAVGADRTGVITYLLNGLLGVSKEDLIRDYLITNFSKQGIRNIESISSRYVNTLDNYTGNTLQEKIYNYLANEVGVPTEDLDFIINYLKE